MELDAFVTIVSCGLNSPLENAGFIITLFYKITLNFEEPNPLKLLAL